MGINDYVPIYYSLAEIQLRGTDRLHCTNEYKVRRQQQGEDTRRE